ncbi:MAG: hypothetical protein K8I29_12100 [Alphaproteobacteria bacterium]|uniref:Type II/III secretion system secretin-like domain-containing protein n=1 Tax=Candidatus Nitrobium versatile TaxID=2884831 RepID=A0A953JFP1_9BACT|nr:hypothetical protein [Candidatus Nitrobium versatile]
MDRVWCYMLSLVIAFSFSTFSVMAQDEPASSETPSGGAAPVKKIIIRVKSSSKYQKEEEKKSRYNETNTERVDEEVTSLLHRENKEPAAKEPEVSLTSYGRRLGDVLLELGGALRYTVIFGSQVDPNLPVVVDLKGVSLTQALSAITEYLNYGYVLEGRKITILKLASRAFSIPDIVISAPTMSADIGGDMLGTSGGGSTGSAYGSVAGGTDSASQNLKASVLLRKAADHLDGRKAFEENVRKLLSPDGHYVLDWNAATLMVHDSPRNISLIERYIAELRASADKVLIVEATITQVSTNADRRFGIDWTLLAERIGGEVLSSGSKSLSFTTTVTDIANPSLTVTRMAGDVSAVLKALEEQGRVNVLSKPFIYARNLQPVAIFEGKSIPYIGSVQKTTTGTIGESTTSYSISRAQDGVMLAVRCHIRDDGKVDIQIAPILATVDEFVTFTLGGDTFTQPVSSVQQTLQSVTLKDGEIVVIGGIKRDKKELSSRAVPVVSQIPLLGEFFRSDNDTNTSSELVIALKAKRVKG